MKRLTILVSASPVVGHVNACAGVLSGLLKRGHRVIFLVSKGFEGKLAKLRYEEYIMPTNEKLDTKFQSKVSKNPGVAAAELFLAAKIIGLYSPIEKEKNLALNRSEMQDMFMYKDKYVKEAIALFKPDLIYVDGGRIPAILYSGIPWIFNISSQPLANIYNENLPPGRSGLPTDGDRSEWAEWSEIRWKNFRCQKLNDSF